MDILLKIVVEVLRLVPAILAFFVPALLGTALLREKGEGYKVKSVLVFLIGFGGIIAIHLMLRSVSALQMLSTVGLSLVQVAAALAAAFLVVYKLAD